MSVDTFLATFKSLAYQAGYTLDAQPTLTTLALKLPFSMMNHIVKIVQPQNFADWCNAIRQYHADNTAVNNLKGLGLGDQAPQKKKKGTLAGMTPAQWAHILRVKLPKDSNAMDTSARSKSFYQKKKKTQARLATASDIEDTQHREGRCFTCNKQGHLSKNCPDKEKKKPKGKAPAKACIAETEDDSAEEESSKEESDDDWAETFIKKARAGPEKGKLQILQKAIKAQQGEVSEEEDF